MSAASVAIVLQARMGSSRLPGKVLAPVGRLPLIGHCIERLQGAGLGPVILATTTRIEDDELVATAQRRGAQVFRGSTDDVLQRYVEAAHAADATYVVRATGDNPAVDSGSAMRLMNVVGRGGADYAVEAGLPTGTTVEMMTFSALATAADRARAAYDREHVTPFLRRSENGFRCAIVPAPAGLCRPDLRFTVDTASDLAYMRRVVEHAEGHAGRRVSLAALIAAADDLGRREEVA